MKNIPPWTVARDKMTTTAPLYDDFTPKVILQVQVWTGGKWIRKANKLTIESLRSARDFYQRKHTTMAFRMVRLTIVNGQVITEEVQ